MFSTIQYFFRGCRRGEGERGEEEEEEEEEVGFTRENRGGSAQHNTRNTAPFKPRTDESLALCHPCTACTVAAAVGGGGGCLY